MLLRHQANVSENRGCDQGHFSMADAPGGPQKKVDREHQNGAAEAEEGVA
jgi:hypothetical protein